MIKPLHYHSFFGKFFVVIGLLLSGSQLSYATNIQSANGGGVWNNLASWSPAQIPGPGDIVTITAGNPIGVTNAAACASVTINAGGKITIVAAASSITVTSSFTVNGTLDCTVGHILGAGSFTLANSNAATLMLGDAGGITTSPTATGNIQNTGSRTFPSAANYVYEGLVNQVTGNGLPTTINSGAILTINSTAVVSLTAGSSNIQNITLKAGSLSLNGKTITVNGTILNSGGNLATSNSGTDGGNFIIQGATLTGPTTFYNLTCNSSSSTITTTGLNAPLVNGTLSIPGSARFTSPNSPRYAKGSTLSYVGGPNNRGPEWNADLSTTPTIGVTPGYPDNVLINSGSDFDICNYALNGNDGAVPRGLDGNLTTSELTMIDWIDYNNSAGPYYHNPQLLQTGSFTVGGNMIVNAGGNINMALIGGSGAFTIKGSLTINGAGANVDLDSMTNVFSVGQGITLNNGTINVGYTGVASKLYVTGDVVQNGGTINDQSGVFSLTGNFTKSGGTFNGLAGTMEFNSTTGSQTFTTHNTSETFNNLIVDEPLGGLTLLQSLNLTGDLTLTNGLVAPGGNTLAMTNGSANVFRTNGWVNSMIQRNISTVGKAYVFPVGDGTHYTPVTLNFASVTTPGNVKVGTFSPFTAISGYASYALSKTKYVDRVWTIFKNSGTLGSYNAIFDYGTTNLVGGATVGNLHTGIYDGSAWTYPNSTGAGTAVTASSITPLGAAASFVGLSECMSPTTYNVTGGGTYCTGGAGVVVGLNNSQTNVNYQLQIGGVNTGAPVSGIGAAISFGNQTASGNYTVVASNAATGCTNNMSGSVTVSTVAAPVVSFTTSPGASSCPNTDITYTTQSGQTNYVWNVPGVSGTDYTISSGGISSTDNTVTLQWVTTGNKTVTVNYSNGSCSAATPASSTTNVVNAFPPTFTGIPPSDVCVGSTVTYATQSGKSNYNWNVPGTLGTDYTIVSGGTGSSDASVLLTWLSTGVKTVTVSYTGGGCSGASATNTTTVDPLPVPTFTAAPSGSVCINSRVTYTTQAGRFNYTWNVPGVAGTDYAITAGGISTTDNTVTLNWLTGGSKTVTVNYSDPVTFCTGGTPASSTVTVSTGATPTFTTTPPANTCIGGSVTYSTQTGETGYTWNVPGVSGTDYSITSGGITTTDNTVTLNWLTSGSKTVTVNYSNGGCVGASPATVSSTVNPLPVPTFTASPANSVCVNSDVAYNTEVSMSNYIWTIPGTSGIDYTIVSGGSTTDNTLVLTWITTGNKTVTVNYTNTSGCNGAIAAVASVTVNPKATPLFTQIGPLCIGGTTLPLATTSDNGIDGSWNPVSPDVNTIGTKHYVFTPSTNFCAVPASMDIVVIDTPVVSGYVSSVFLMQGSSIVLQGTVADPLNNSIAWTPNDNTINNATIANPTVSPLVDQSYKMVVTSTLAQHCTSSVTVLVKIQYGVSIPSSFSPNDDKVHDIWYITNLDLYPNAEVEVFNRYGQAVFLNQGNYMESPWDGKYNGNALATGTYYYIINLNNGQAPIAGFVTLIR